MDLGSQIPLVLQLCEALEQIEQNRDISAQWQVSVVGQDTFSALVSFVFLSQFFLSAQSVTFSL